jgi:hypothetical protein
LRIGGRGWRLSKDRGNPGAGLLQKRVALIWRTVQCRLEYVVNLFPAFGLHRLLFQRILPIGHDRQGRGRGYLAARWNVNQETLAIDGRFVGEGL